MEEILNAISTSTQKNWFISENPRGEFDHVIFWNGGMVINEKKLFHGLLSAFASEAQAQ